MIFFYIWQFIISGQENMFCGVSTNYTHLLTMFNVVVVCPSESLGKVATKIETEGAGVIQHGFIINETKDIKRTPHDQRRGMLRYWALVCNQDLYQQACPKESEKRNQCRGGVRRGGQPESVYNWLVDGFSAPQDVVLDIGSKNGMWY
ncbi:uncharacterized protein LOC116616876 [Nematostella vectensis]|uniref:uncharacterized protein LOC116616876 n=1 Tax=Nematostella vectensis TaxID=45351 RepID=UPI00138FBBF9|nr:uncharacterized protein LOC116616876 [Nematostella vectensis]